MSCLSKITDIEQGGSIANSNGKRFSERVCDVLLKKGYRKIKSNIEPTKMQHNTFCTEKTLKPVLFAKKHSKVDIFVVNSLYPNGLVIECKSQNSTGTAREKIPYTIIRIAELQIPSILVMDGKFLIGCNSIISPFEWSKKQLQYDGVTYTKYLHHSFTFDEFKQYVKGNF